jgi:hypothetical protein
MRSALGHCRGFEEMSEIKMISALRAIGVMHKTQVNMQTYKSRCAICKTPVPCETNRLVLDALAPEKAKS